MSDTATRLLAVDGNSMAHRAWHAISDSPDAVDDFVTSGVLSLIAAVWHHGPYGALLVAFDHSANLRKTQHPTYKANRSTDPELTRHLQTLPEHLAELGIATTQSPGIEADDLLAAAAGAATAQGWRTDVLSGDRDLTALVADRVRLLRPRATMSDLVVYDAAMVVDHYGVQPSQYLDFAALRGDPSDGLAGVTGIGPKAAATLLADHGDLDGLYANLCYLPARMERALRAGRTRAFANRAIMAPLAVDVSLASTIGMDVDVLVNALEETGRYRAARRWARADYLARQPPRPPMPVLEPTVIEQMTLTTVMIDSFSSSGPSSGPSSGSSMAPPVADQQTLF